VLERLLCVFAFLRVSAATQLLQEMSVSLSGSYSPNYNDTESTAHIEIHKKGFCPYHPDVQIVSRTSLLHSKQNKVCPRCEEIHKLKIREMEQKQVQSTDIGTIIAEKERNVQDQIFSSLITKSLHRPLKVVLIGDSGVGKTSISERYFKDSFNQSPTATVGVNFSKQMNDHFILFAFDTAGQEMHHSTSRSFLRDTDAVILVYDITNDGTFRSCEDHTRAVKEYSRSDNTPIYIFGNKSDLERRREVSRLKVDKFCEINGYTHYLVSAKDATNLRESITDVIVNAAIHVRILESKTIGDKELITLTPPPSSPHPSPNCC
jgi:small GTP-binding protein